MTRSVCSWLVLLLLMGAGPGAASENVKLEGYAEWRQGDALLVEGQRVHVSRQTRFKGKGRARDFYSIPLGYEVEVEGQRLGDGAIAARKLEAKPNGSAMFEGDLRAAFDQTEASWRQRGRVFETANGRTVVLGELKQSGPEVRRVQRITERLIPPYMSPGDFRVYVIENDEWNAMAAPNGSIYVFSGLLRDMDDDEVAIILGHELVHATHEHSRKQFKKQIWIQLAALGAIGLAGETIDNDTHRAIVQVLTAIGASAWSSGYGREHEDQADRVGLRYAHEGRFDVSKGPGLWNRFARKYGDQNKALNFFFGDHSVARDRERNLRQEIALNYRP